MRGRREQTTEDYLFERRVLAAYGPLCERFFYTQLVGVTGENWDRTSRQAAIRKLAEAQPLYLQPESVRDRNSILMVNANGRGVGQLDERTAERIAGSLHEGREWHAHVRSVDLSEGDESTEVVVMLLLIVAPDRYAQLVQERRQLMNGDVTASALFADPPARDFSVEWTLVALLLLGAALTMW